MRFWNVTWMIVMGCLIGPLATRCGAQVTLTWTPSTSPGLASYNLCWGTNSGVYLYTNNYPATQTNATISTLAAGEVFYFAVQSVGSNDTVSAFSSEEEFTNNLNSSTTSTNGLASGGGGGSTNSTTNTSTQVAGGGGNGGNSGGGSGTGGNGTSGSGLGGTSTNAATFWGIPPFVGLALSNGQVNLNLGSTVGAQLTIMGSTSDLSLDTWSPVTNLTVSNIATTAESSQTNGPQDLLDVAFVPGTETVPVVMTNAAPFQFFRVVMPYDYIILADQVLSANSNYVPRLIVVNMPGVVADDACYENNSGSFIHCIHTNYSLQLISSGSTIRQIATTLASSLNLDWTSASEFTYSNGLGQVLATVIETEPPSADPVAGQNPPSAPIVINF